MRLWGKVELLEPYPVAYIPSLHAIVVADLHLGYEGIMAEQGIFIPKTQFEKEMNVLRAILERVEARSTVLCGDVKHEFSETSYHEFIEVAQLFEFLRGRFEDVTVIKGNHDNYIVRVTRRYGIALRNEFELGDFYFFHGHVMPKGLEESKARYVIMGHEHPAIMLYDEVGGKEKVDCFLHGYLAKRRLLVLPAFSTLAEGSQVNIIPRGELLSPVLRELVDVDGLKAIGVDEEAGYLKFPELGKLRTFRA